MRKAFIIYAKRFLIFFVMIVILFSMVYASSYDVSKYLKVESIILYPKDPVPGERLIIKLIIRNIGYEELGRVRSKLIVRNHYSKEFTFVIHRLRAGKIFKKVFRFNIPHEEQRLAFLVQFGEEGEPQLLKTIEVKSEDINPSIVYFKTSKEVINAGEPVKLYWKLRGIIKELKIEYEVLGHKLKRRSGYIRLRNRKIGFIFIKPEFPTYYKLVAKFLIRKTSDNSTHFRVFELSKLVKVKTRPLIKYFKADPSVVTPSSSTRYPAETRINCDIRGATDAKLICAGSIYKINPWGDIVRVPIYNKTKCVLKAMNTYFETEKSIEIQIKPKITSFKVSPSLIKAGSRVRLNWSFIGADKAIIEPGIGSVLNKRSVYVRPSETTVYKLRISSEQGEDEKTVRVRVSPVISYFKVNKRAIYPGESVNLSWKVKGGVEKVSIIRKNEDIKEVLVHEDNKAVGSFKDTPDTEYLKFFYRLNVKNDAGEDTSKSIVVYFKPKILYFKADKYEIKYGEDVKLYWKAVGVYKNRTMLKRNGSIILINSSPVQEMGFVVNPKETTTYILTVRGPKGSAKETIVVKVRK